MKASMINFLDSLETCFYVMQELKVKVKAQRQPLACTLYGNPPRRTPLPVFKTEIKGLQILSCNDNVS